MFSNRLYSPLRYPGGKASFAPFIAKLMVDNGLAGGHYLEPYAGGAGVALDLLFQGQAKHIHINDADPAVYAFWVSVTQYPNQLLELLASTPITMAEWFKWRSVLREECQASVVEKGFATLFMNRTNRSGILKAGVIGGKKQEGAYKLDARFKKDVISARILAIAKRAQDITVYSEDSLVLLKRCKDFLPKDSLIYLDPPYYVKGKGLYRNYYEHDDHVAIAKAIQAKSFKRHWVVSYDNTDEISAMYQFANAKTYGLNYTAHRRYVGNEVMFFSQGLIVSEDEIPRAKGSV
ncbi:DNA adenine methylase [Undibacterium sp. SXout7W]|uniref:DNA adenine methylase n=1 Tax=Undibacterium sp. SXout7W TaxID=3413049 RepID=UPI003BEF5CC6